MLEHNSTAIDLRNAGIDFVDRVLDGDVPTALGAAVARSVMTDQPHFSMREPFMIALIDRYGATFAAECAVSAAGLAGQFHPDTRGPQYGASRSLRYRDASDLTNMWIFEPHSRVRSALAALPPDEYQAAVERLREFRGRSFSQNIAISFLFPTERTWWAEDLVYVSSLDYDFSVVHFSLALLSCVDTVHDVETLFQLCETRDYAVWMIGQRMNLVCSMAVNVGPGVEPYLGELFDGNVSAQHKKRLAMMLAEFDTDAGLSELLSRADKKYVEPALLHALTLDSNRASRMLPRTTGRVAQRLLREHLILNPLDEQERNRNNRRKHLNLFGAFCRLCWFTLRGKTSLRRNRRR